jgi:hypothetical protein
MTHEEKLPPLPKRAIRVAPLNAKRERQPMADYFTADQMRAYAQSAREQALTECQAVCEAAAERHMLRNDGKWPELQTSGQAAAEECVEEIRALKGQK